LRFFTANHTNRHEPVVCRFDFTRLILFIFVIIFFSFIFSSCTKQDTSRIELALGTVCGVTLFDNARNSVYDDIFSRIQKIENLMSVNIPSSDISRINSAAGIEPVQVHEEVFKVIERAKYFAEISGGAFDPTVGPLVSIWGIGSENQRVPAREEIDAVLPLINHRLLELDAVTRSVFLTQKGMALDLGAIAKGYAADVAAETAIDAGIKSAKIDFGGNIVLTGIKADKTPWKVGIRNPQKDSGSIIGILQITVLPANFPSVKTIVTSGVYERYFEKDGNHYHHIFDPSTGYPAEKGLISVTLVTDISMDADALSTAVFVLGFEEGIRLLESFPGTEAVFVFKDKTIITTSRAAFSLTDMEYTMINTDLSL